MEPWAVALIVVAAIGIIAGIFGGTYISTPQGEKI